MKSNTVISAYNRARSEVYARREVRKPDEVSDFAFGWVVLLGRDQHEGTLIYLADKSNRPRLSDGETQTPQQAQFFDEYADALTACAEIMRDSLESVDASDFPAPEFPRVAYVRFAASVWMGSNS